MKRIQPLVAGWVIAAHPDVILLQVGTNDLLAGVSAAVTAAWLDTMLTTVRSVRRHRSLWSGCGRHYPAGRRRVGSTRGSRPVSWTATVVEPNQ